MNRWDKYQIEIPNPNTKYLFLDRFRGGRPLLTGPSSQEKSDGPWRLAGRTRPHGSQHKDTSEPSSTKQIKIGVTIFICFVNCTTSRNISGISELYNNHLILMIVVMMVPTRPLFASNRSFGQSEKTASLAASSSQQPMPCSFEIVTNINLNLG